MILARWSHVARIVLVGLFAALSVATASAVSAAPGWYTFSFDPNGGNATPAGTRQYSGRSPIANACYRPGFRTGYTFIGWRSDYSGTSTVYGHDCQGSGYYSVAGTTMPEADVVFTAEWQANTLTITYDSNGGSSVTDGDATTVSGGTISTLPTNPTRTGYTFAGWYTATSGGTQITTSSPHGQTSNFTLYARWIGNTLNITYDSQGAGPVTDGATTTRVGDPLNPLPTPPDRLAEGFLFMGWNTAADGSGVDLGVTIAPGNDGPAHSQTSDFTMYAQWSGLPLTITYNSQSGSSVSNGSTTVGGTISTLPTTTRTGYTFAGWYTATSGGTQITTSAAHGQTSDFTLYAQWTANTTAPVSSGSASPPVPAPVPPWPEAAVNAEGIVTVSWAEPLDHGGSPITGYRAVARPQSAPITQASEIQLSASSGDSCATTKFTCLIDGLDENVDYLFEVFASNSFGESPGRMTQWTIRIVSRVPAATEPESVPNPAPTASEPPQLPVTGRTSDLANWALLLVTFGALTALRLRRPQQQHR
jgi:uncharacterized repeat protein (TIGR02543 family)